MLRELKDFILFRELTEILDVSSSMINNIIIDYDLIEGIDYIKKGLHIFLRKDCQKLPVRYLESIKKTTDLDKLVPITEFIKKILTTSNNNTQISKTEYLIKNNYIEIVNVKPIKFVRVLNLELFDIINSDNKTLYPVRSRVTVANMLKNKEILGSIRVGSQIYLTYY